MFELIDTTGKRIASGPYEEVVVAFHEAATHGFGAAKMGRGFTLRRANPARRKHKR